MWDLNLKGKYALVTGASKGIGLSVTNYLAAEGCQVTAVGRSFEEGPLSIKVKHFKCNLLIPDAIQSLQSDVIDRLPRVDILVHAAGASAPHYTKTVYQEAYQLHVFALAKLIEGVLPKMQGWGRVVSVASKQGKEGGGHPWYTSSKASQIALMKSFANQQSLSRAGITFNSVAPGKILNKTWLELAKLDPIKYEEIVKSTPLGRLGFPEEVARVIVFLCSNKASLINGACIAIDGGESRSF